MNLKIINNLQPNDKLVFNTAIIYLNSVISIFVMLYVTRIVIKYLGADDFGLNNVVGGVVSMLTFVSASMSVSTQRYISHALGSGESDKLNKIYSNSFVIHLVLAVAMVMIFEIVGIYIINNKLLIDADRHIAAHFILQFTIINTFFTIMATPNDAAINAKENMTFLALLGIGEVILKLLVAVLLQYWNGDRLILYGFALMMISIIMRLIKAFHVKRNYREFAFNKSFVSRNEIKKLYSFAGWSLFGVLSIVGKNQGFAIALNMVFGTVVNAAFAISNQVSNQLLFFSRNLLKSMNPQIVKLEGAGKRYEMIELSFQACKFGFIMTAFIGIPFIFEMETILKIWLTTVPQYTSLFCQYMILSLLISQLTIGLQTAVQATGQIKLYELLVGTIQLMNVPVYFVLFQNGAEPFYAIIAYCVFELIACMVRLQMFNRIMSSNMSNYLLKVSVRQLVPAIASFLSCIIIHQLVIHDLRILLTFAVSIPAFFAVAYFYSLTPSEKDYLNSLTIKLLRKVGVRTEIHR